MQFCDDIGEVMHMAISPRILEHRAEHSGCIEFSKRVTDNDLPAQRLGAGADHLDGLRVTVMIDEKRGLFGFRGPLCHGHGFRCRSSRPWLISGW